MSSFVQMVDTIGQNLDGLISVPYWQERRIASYTTRAFQASDGQFARIKHPVKIDQAPTDSLARGAVVKDVEAGAATIQNAVNCVRAGHKFVTYLSHSDLQACRNAMARAGIHMQYWVADWGFNETAAFRFMVDNLDVVAVQWASPSSNPNTMLPGTGRTLRQANVDLSVTRPGWPALITPPRPVHPPVVVPRHARGVFKAELAYDHDKQTVHVQGAPGKVADWGSVDEWLRLEVAVKVGPHGTGSWTGKVLGTIPAHPPMKPPAQKGVSVPGHPELKPHIAWVVNRIRDAWPRLIITSTTGGQHAPGSFHHVGRACDLGTDPFDQGYQDRAAAWVASHLTLDLVEGIHNPSLSVKDRRVVDPSFWGVQTWSAHRNHLHVAA